MNNEKLLYEAPTAQTFVVRFEGMICTSPGAWDSAIVAGTNWGDDEDYGLE